MSAHDNPGVIAPPPLVYLAGLLIGFVLDYVLRALLVPFNADGVGGVLIVMGLMVGFWALYVMRVKKTSPLPERPTTAIVADGPFAFTRNPIYLGFTLIYVGITLWRNSLWLALVLPVVLLVMHYGVIVREERYLEGKFGPEYVNYKAKVRRWI